MALIYKGTGWGYMGYSWPFGWQGSWPFSIFELYEDKIILKLFPFKKEVKFEEVDYIKRGSFFPVVNGIKIIHHGNGASNLQFGSYKRDNLIKILKETGIRIQT